jgi:hypothetical protein
MQCKDELERERERERERYRKRERFLEGREERRKRIEQRDIT